MAAIKATHLLRALQLLGRVPETGPYNTSQSLAAFKRSLDKGRLDINDKDFADANRIAQDLANEPAYDPGGNLLAQAVAGLRARGVSADDVNKILVRGQAISRSQAGSVMETTYQVSPQTPSGSDPDSAVLGLGLTPFFQAAQELAPKMALVDVQSGLEGAGVNKAQLHSPPPPPPTPAQAKPGATVLPGDVRTADLPAATGLLGKAKGLAARPAPAPGVTGSPPGQKAPATAAEIAAEMLRQTPKAAPKTPGEISAEITAIYGWGAALADIPEVAGILADAYSGNISAGVANNRFLASDYYKTTSAAERTWKMFERTDPADAARKKTEQRDILVGIFAETGYTPDPGRVDQLTDLSLRYGWNATQVRAFVASEIRYDPNLQKTGVIGQLQDTVREWLVPLSDQTVGAWASSIVGGSKTTEDFTEYLRSQSKSMFPGLGTALDDPNLTTRKYLDPYAEIAGQMLGVRAADINWTDPKWIRAVNTIDAKTNQRGVMNLADWQRTLMTDPAYGFDESIEGAKQKTAVTTGLLKSFGFQA